MRDWAEATLKRNVVVAPGLHRLQVEVPPSVAGALHRPGQYHWVRLGDAGEAPFAIASPPGAGTVFEYLVRHTGRVGTAWTELAEGAPLEVSLPEGVGFPLEAARGRALYLVGTGTGWGPLRAVLQVLLMEREAYGPVRAVYGAHSPEQLAYAEEFDALRAAGVEVVATVSEGAPGWTGATGRVQQHLGAPLGPEAVAFLCGQADMVRDLTDLLGRAGVPPSRIFLNA
jgi:NAD(P)H-flavin reductase